MVLGGKRIPFSYLLSDVGMIFLSDCVPGANSAGFAYAERAWGSAAVVGSPPFESRQLNQDATSVADLVSLRFIGGYTRFMRATRIGGPGELEVDFRLNLCRTLAKLRVTNNGFSNALEPKDWNSIAANLYRAATTHGAEV